MLESIPVGSPYGVAWVGRKQEDSHYPTYVSHMWGHVDSNIGAPSTGLCSKLVDSKFCSNLVDSKLTHSSWLPSNMETLDLHICDYAFGVLSPAVEEIVLSKSTQLLYT